MDSAVTDAASTAGPPRSSMKLRVAGTALLAFGMGLPVTDQVLQQREAAAEHQQFEQLRQDVASSDPAVRAEASRRLTRFEIHEPSSILMWAGIAAMLAGCVLRVTLMVQDAKRKW